MSPSAFIISLIIPDYIKYPNHRYDKRIGDLFIGLQQQHPNPYRPEGFTVCHFSVSNLFDYLWQRSLAKKNKGQIL